MVAGDYFRRLSAVFRKNVRKPLTAAALQGARFVRCWTNATGGSRRIGAANATIHMETSRKSPEKKQDFCGLFAHASGQSGCAAFPCCACAARIFLSGSFGRAAGICCFSVHRALRAEKELFLCLRLRHQGRNMEGQTLEQTGTGRWVHKPGREYHAMDASCPDPSDGTSGCSPSVRQRRARLSSSSRACSSHGVRSASGGVRW